MPDSTETEQYLLDSQRKAGNNRLIGSYSPKKEEAEMDEDTVARVEHLARQCKMEFRDLGNGHLQLRAGKRVVNYYPFSKNKTVWCNDLKIKRKHCDLDDLWQVCTQKRMEKKRKRSLSERKEFLRRQKESFVTNPLGLTEFYSGEVPPWDEGLGEFQWEV